MSNLKNEYITKVKNKLDIPSKYKDKLLENLEESVDEYLQKNSNCTYEDIEETFGTVDEIAESLYDSIDREEIAKKIKFKKIILLGIIGVLIIFVISFVIYVSYLEKLKQEIPVYVVEEIVEQ